MKEQKTKHIAVLMSAIALDNQRRLFNGMVEAAKEIGCNLYFFANYINFPANGESVEGSYHVLKLPDFDKFDGAIIVKNLIRHQETAEYVTNAMQKSGIPAVSIDVEIPGMSWLGVSTYEAQMEIIEHLILEHNCNDICYVSGPLINAEAKRRFKAYRDTLEKHGLKFDKKNVYHGYFDLSSGRAAAERFLENGKCSKAIVCASDDMATGVIEFLEERGYKIPEDVKVTGFDDAEYSKMQTPTVTTINKNQEETGYRAVYEVMSLIGGSPISKQHISYYLQLRRSCGCPECNEIGLEELKKTYRTDKILTQRIADMIRNMTSSFSGMEKPDELIEELKKFIVRITDMEAFYLCLCDRDKVFVKPEDDMSGSLDINQINTDYTPEITIPLAYERGEFKEYGVFPKGQVLPEECRNEGKGNYYIVSPINYQRMCYGYSVIKNSRFPADNLLYYSWVVNIGIGLENIRKWMLLKDTVVRLNGVWAYDMLTRLYNRAGFYHNSKNLFLELRKQDKKVFIMFMDMDGLKKINDTLGHEIGDWMIKEMADVIRQNLSDNQIAMRYGGDEFVIFGSVEKEEELKDLIAKLYEAMEKRSRENDNLFELRASIGTSIYKAKDIKSLDVVIEEADKRMYEEKRRRKALLKQQEDAGTGLGT